MDVDRRVANAGIMACLLASFISTYSLMMVSVSMKDIQQSMGISVNEALWFTWCPIIATLGMCFLSSSLADKYGKKKVLIAGLVITIITSFFSFFSNDYSTLLALRVIQGGGMSFLYVSMVSIMTDLAAPGENARVMGYNNIFSQLGSIIAVICGYLITNAVGWHYIGLVLIPVSLAALYMIRDVPEVVRPDVKPHFTNQVMFAAIVVCFLFGLGLYGKNYGDLLIIISLVLLVPFILSQGKKDHWIIDYGLLRDNIPFRIGTISAFAMYIVIYNTAQLTGSLLQALDIPLAREVAVLLTIVGPLVQIVVTWLITHKLEFMSEIRKLEIGFILSLGASLMLVRTPFVDNTTDMVLCSIALVVTYVASGFFIAPNTSLMMSSVPPEKRNEASSINNFIRQFDKISGSMLVVVMMIGIQKSEMAGVFKVAFGWLGILFIAVLAIAAYLLYRYKKQGRLEVELSS